MMTSIIRPIRAEAVKTQEKISLLVAAYCRVSTDTEEQLSSFSNQVRYYTETINANPEWKLAGIYADEGITGTSVAKREQFQRMLKDCKSGKINLILTKSISRFARNTLECLTYVRELNEIGVHIVFESNHIDTRSAYSEMLLTVLAAFAQEESRSISENTKWGIRKRFENGTARWCRLYGYEKNDKGEYQIVPEQAFVVRKVFELYEHGMTISQIIQYMDDHQIKSPEGGRTWSSGQIGGMLSNERYVGDIILQKSYIENHITHKPVRNDHSKVPGFYIENHHEPIIARRQFERCQRIKNMRVRRVSLGDPIGNQYPLGEKLRCPYCGSTLVQHFVPVQSCRTKGWCCENGEDVCHGFIIRSYIVEEAIIRAYRELKTEWIQEKCVGGDLSPSANLAIEIKKANPEFERVDYWWVDDMIDYIEFGKHSRTDRECRRQIAMGETYTEDRTMVIHWRFGMTTTSFSGVGADRDHPARIAYLYNQYLEKHKVEKGRCHEDN